MHEATSWQGDERIRLVQEGYRSLAIIVSTVPFLIDPFLLFAVSVPS